MRYVIVIFALSVAFLFDSTSTEAQEIPLYTLSAFISGSTKETSTRSTPDGHASLSGDPATFHFMRLSSDLPERLSFKMLCRYWDNDTKQPEDAVGEAGGSCPPFGPSKSARIQAILIVLEGPDKERYRLEARCQFHGEMNNVEVLFNFLRHPAQSWCGYLGKVPDNSIFGLSAIELWLTPN